MKHTSYLIPALLICLFMGLSKGLQAQYTLDEVGVNAGIGGAFIPGISQTYGGPLVKANIHYGHFFCGKAFGIRAEGGFNYAMPSDDLFRFQIIQFEGGFFFKLKRRDYHRPKEWAVIVGPKVHVPLFGHYSTLRGEPKESGPLSDLNVAMRIIQPMAHLSVQIRRPVGDKKSLFIQPGVEYGIQSEFTGLSIGSFNRWNIFLNIGYAFFDKRG